MGHLQRRRQGHEGVEAVVVLAAERAGVGQGGRCYQGVQGGTGL